MAAAPAPRPVTRTVVSAARAKAGPGNARATDGCGPGIGNLPETVKALRRGLGRYSGPVRASNGEEAYPCRDIARGLVLLAGGRRPRPRPGVGRLDVTNGAGLRVGR